MNMKQKRVDFLVEQGIPTADARLVVDMAEHAADKALDTISSVTNTVPIHLRSMTYIMASKLLSVNIEAGLRIFQEARGDASLALRMAGEVEGS